MLSFKEWLKRTEKQRETKSMRGQLVTNADKIKIT